MDVHIIDWKMWLTMNPICSFAQLKTIVILMHIYQHLRLEQQAQRKVPTYLNTLWALLKEFHLPLFT